MVIAVASGKGGTGKTTVATNLASVIPQVQLLDCDVEEPNAHLFLQPEIEREVSVTIPIPRIKEEVCTHCRKCSEACEFHAILVFPKEVLVFDELCHGCGVCSYICPEGAIEEVPKEIGKVLMGRGKGIDFTQGLLKVSEPMATPVIKREKEFIQREKVVVLDAPPGTSCPVVETVKGSDFCLLVTEPTPFGLNDLQLAVGMVRKLNIPMGVVINRSTVGDDQLRRYCEREGLPILMEIPLDEEIARICSEGGLLTESSPDYRREFFLLYERIRDGWDG